MGTSRSYLSVFPVLQIVEPLVVLCLMNFMYKAGGSKISEMIKTDFTKQEPFSALLLKTSLKRVKICTYERLTGDAIIIFFYFILWLLKSNFDMTPRCLNSFVTVLSSPLRQFFFFNGPFGQSVSTTTLQAQMCRILAGVR